MTHAEHLAELQVGLKETIARWCPEFSRLNETFDIQIMRALLHFRAYDLDAQRALRGEAPIRNDYPLPLPGKKP